MPRTTFGGPARQRGAAIASSPRMTPSPTYAEQLEAARHHLVDVLAGAPADPEQLRGLRCAVGILRRLAEREEERQAAREGGAGGGGGGAPSG